MMDGLMLEEVEVFNYLGSLVTGVGRVEQRVLEWSEEIEAARRVWLEVMKT